MEDIPLDFLLIALAVSLLVFIIFANSETVLLTLNQFRLELQARKKLDGGNSRPLLLFSKPADLVSVIQLAKIVSIILSASLITLISLRAANETVLAAVMLVYTFLTLSFIQILATVLHNQPATSSPLLTQWIYLPLLRFFYGLNWLIKNLSAPFAHLLLLVAKPKQDVTENRIALHNQTGQNSLLTSARYQNMLMRILDLDAVKVDDIMTHRNDIFGIDIDDSLENIVQKILHSPHTRLPVYQKTIDCVIGFLHLRTILSQLNQPGFDKLRLKACITKPFFIPAGTSIHRQMQNFKTEKLRIGMVVDEYGDVLGLISLDDLLQELVGELIAEPVDLQKLNDGSYLVDAGISIRDINRVTQWNLPVDGPKTLNGLILEKMETIPTTGLCIKLFGHELEIILSDESAVKLVKFPSLH